MNRDTDEILALFRELDALLEGHFLLSSGRHSDTYFQCARVLQFPELARELGRRLADRLTDGLELDAVVSPALGALLLGHEVARAVGRRFLFTERVAGKMTLRRGFALEPGERVLIVEDVITRGTSTREVAAVVAACDATVAGVACLVDRTGGAVDLPAPPVSLLQVAAVSWEPGDCPLCRQGLPLVKPGSRETAAP